MVTYHLGHTFICFVLMLYGANLDYVGIERYLGVLDPLKHPGTHIWSFKRLMLPNLWHLSPWELLILKTKNSFDQRFICMYLGGFCPFWTIKYILERLPLTHALHHSYNTLIYVLTCFIHVHMAIHDRLRWFGSLLVNLGGFEVQSKPARCMPPIFLLRVMIFSHCIINKYHTYLHHVQ